MSETANRLPRSPVLPEPIAREIDTIEAEIERFRTGELSPERFRAFRLAHGIYGQRQAGVQMIRVKIPAGVLTGRQMRRIADIAQEFSPTALAHLTTRQDVQYHHVPLDRVPHLLRLLAEVGLTSREACGNSVRNVTSCPVAGALAEEVFDVTPFAEATTRYLMRNAFCQQLARKFKIAFSSCPEDCAATAIHDIGLVGRTRDEAGTPRHGFTVLVGGGLGSTPFTARILEEFVPAEDLLVTIKAILQVFSDLGHRRNKMKARLKFVVHRLGIEVFRGKVAEARAALTDEERREADLFPYVPPEQAPMVARLISRRFANGWTPAGALAEAFHRLRTRPAPPPAFTEAGLNKGVCAPPAASDVPPAGFLRWQSTNVRRHKDPTRAIVTVSIPLGDIDAPRLRALSNLVTAFAADEARVAIHQNFVLPHVPRESLRDLYDGLDASQLAESSAGTALDVTSCPGADTCGLGITSSKGLARAIRSELLPMVEDSGPGALRGVTVKISGCPNSCGQHHIANIGLHGVVKKVDGRQIPAYQLHFGGGVGRGSARIGEAMTKMSAKNVPKAVAALLRRFEEGRNASESFAEWAARAPSEEIRRLLAPFADAGDETDDARFDWGQSAPFTTGEIGVGECAGAGTDVAVNPFDNFESEILQASLFMERGQWVDALANLNRSQYTLARVLLEALGKHPDSDYETVSELRAQIIDRGDLSEAWNELHASIAERLRRRAVDPGEVRALHARALDLLAESKAALPAVAARRSASGAEMPG